MAVNYDAGTSGAIATQYADLRSAIASKGEAENRQKARDIERKGLFGSGIKQSDLQDFGNIAIKGAEFGEARMGRKMDRATKSFERRQKADERRLATLQKRHDKGQLDKAGLAELDGIQMGMRERRDSFEDFMGKYQEKGLWGTSFGGDDVGYRTEGESKYSQAMRPKDESDWSNLGDLGEGRRAGEGGPPDRYSSYPHQPREFEKMDYETAEERSLGERIRAIPKVDRDLTGEELDKWGRPVSNKFLGPGPGAGGRGSGGSAMGSGPGPGGGRGEQWNPDVSDLQASGIEGYGSGMMNLGDRGFKKKDDLGGRVGTMANPEDTAHMRPRSEFSNKFEQKPSNRYMPGVLRNLTQNQRNRMDVLERQGLIKEKEQALGQQKSEENQMIQDIANKYRRRKLGDLVSGIDLN